MTMTLADLLAPLGPERFFAEHHDRQPLHLRGAPGKFASVLSWRGINRLLDMTHIWSSQSLQLVLDGTPLGDAHAPHLWPLARGRHELRLVDAHGVAIDAVGFVVR